MECLIHRFAGYGPTIGPFPRLFPRPSSAEAARLAEVLRNETVGGVLLVIAAMAGLVWINSPWGESYEQLRDTTVGPSALHLDLSLGTWAADGLLAIFFFVAGLELKREFVAGDLRDVRRAALPVAAAVGGMALPALIYLAVNLTVRGGSTAGWAVPAATDIAFALAVLAVVAPNLPDALRTFLLTLAVVDDLLAITIIALFYTADLEPLALLTALVPVALFGWLVQRRFDRWWLLVPLALLAWLLVHESGVHATVAGVLLALTVPVAPIGDLGRAGLAERFEHRLRPLSAAVAVPIFALLSAGVAVAGLDGLADAASDPVAIGIVLGLVVGKAIGVLGSAALVARFTHAHLDKDLGWWDVLGVSLLAGLGFTVSLLIAELAFGVSTEQSERAKVGILVGSVVAILLAAVVLRMRERGDDEDRPESRSGETAKNSPAADSPSGARKGLGGYSAG
jgi:NhaA family Na+:H+ antiporter